MPRRVLVIVVVFAALAATSLLLGRRGERSAAGGRAVRGEASATPPAVDTLRAPGVPAVVTRFLEQGQSWRAARALRTHLAERGDAPPEAVLLAARAEGGWGGWDRVRPLLEDRPWLDRVRGGEGWYWLARAREEDGDRAAALDAYTRYLAVAPVGEAHDDRRLVAELRRALLLLRLGRAEEGVALLEGLQEHVVELEPRLNLLAAEALAERGDTARVRSLVEAVELPELRMRGRRAVLAAYREAGDPATARSLAERYRAQAESDAARAELAVTSARLALSQGDTAAARAALLSAVNGAPGSGAGRDAARLLAELPGLSADQRLAVAQVLDRHGANGRAATLYRAWLRPVPASDQAREVRLRLGQALFDAGEYAEAVEALQPLADAPGRVGADALHLRARAEYRRGNRERALRQWMRLAELHPRSDAGAEGLFLVADLSHDAGEERRAAGLYRRVATEFPGTDRAGLSLMRLAGIRYLDRDFAGAAAAWNEYRTSYPGGERWLQAAYWEARAREAVNDAGGARELYQEIRRRDPLSYYALRAAERLGEPFWPIPTAPPPPDNPAARERVQRWMHSVDLLRAAGLHEEAEAEADRWIQRAGDDEALLYPLAETLNERGLTVRGIRIGQRLQRAASRPNERLLRILYPFPYRAMVAAEATEKGLDPFLVAALTRQESLFKARISSPVGARGLMQVMPETGRLLARGVGIRSWDDELLFQPEINVHLGTRYLAEQMERYDGSLPSVFSAYNAGPQRIDRWRQFPEYRDEELFTERIPYRETRDYVKILTRNIALYRALYGATEADG